MWLLALCLLICAVAFAQSTTEGAISGTVYDSTGAVVPGAAIVVHNNATNTDRTVKSDATGSYRVGSLQPAVYTVSVSVAGFAPYKAQQVTVNVGTITELSPRLNVGNTAETVTVSAEAPQINTTSADFAPVVNETAVANLPINGNRWSNFALLTPTVIHNGDGFGLISFRGMSVLLNNNTIDGADNNQAFFAEERGRTRAGYSTSKAAVQEFQVNTSNYSAEYGRSAGGVINTVTKSGTNILHGEMYFYDRDNSWGAYNPFTRLAVKDPTSGVYNTVPYKPKDWRKISGFTVGGPIKKDKLFFFMAFDWYKRVFPGTSIPSNPTSFFATPSATDAATLAGRLAVPAGSATDKCGAATASAYSMYDCVLNDLAADMGPVPRYGQQFIWMPKLDWQIDSRNRLSLSGNRMRWHSPAGIQTQATNTYGNTSFGNDDVKDTWVIGRLDSLINDHWANELRMQWGRDFEFQSPQPPNAIEQSILVAPTAGPQAGYVNPYGLPVKVSLSGMTFGVAEFLTRPKYPDEKRWQFADTMTHTFGKHTLKFGLDYSHVNDLSQNLRYQFGEYSYSSIIDFASDFYANKTCRGTVNKVDNTPIECYSRFTQGFGPLGYQFNTSDYAFFIQDSWKIHPRLTLNFGLRFEYEQPPRAFSNLVNPAIPQTGQIASDNNNFGPRVGFAWDVFGNGKTSFRGGWGIYYGRLINSTIYNALTQTGITGGQAQYQLNNNITGAPLFPTILAAAPTGVAGAKPNIMYIDPHFNLPQIHQVDLSIERDIGWNTVVSLAYLGSFGRQLPSFMDVNLKPPTSSITYTIGNGGPIAGPYTLPLYAGARPNAAYGAMTDIFSGVSSNYNAMVLQLNHRMSRSIQFGYNLTWARAFDYAQNQQTFTDTNDFLFPNTPNAISQAYGRSQYDIPLRQVFHAVAVSPWHKTGPAGVLANGWQLSPVFQWQEGLPYSLSESGNALGGTVGGINGSGTGSGYTSAQGNFGGFNYIPAFGRNTFRARNNYGIDLKISKTFTYKERYSVEFSGEGFNLFNHQNVTNMQSTGYLVGSCQGTYNVATGSCTKVTGAPTIATMTYCGDPGAATSPCNNGPTQTITNANSNFAWTPRQVQLGLRLRF